MFIKRTHAFITILALFIFQNILFAQLDVKRDDFVGGTNRNWWDWYDDGPNTPIPAVSDGYVLFSLIDPDTSVDPFCDAALWDGYPAYGGPYKYCEITLRARALNPHKLGSRGWGLWYTEPYPYLQNQAWFMRVLDSSGTGYTGLDWWRAETANGRTEAVHNYTDIDVEPHLIEDQKWHTYKIIRDTNFIAMVVDLDTVLYVTENLPKQDMAFHIWVDNLVYEHVDPDTIKIHKRGWSGKNEIVLDYVQIVTPSGELDKSGLPSGLVLLRQVPNEIYSDTTVSPWKNWSFSAPTGDIVTLVTARVEQYLDTAGQPISFDDDIRLVVDGTDYGWDTSTSFNADESGTTAKTMLFEQSATSGSKTLQVYGSTSPLLYDVTVLGSENGGVVFDTEYNETKMAGTDSLWKEISFNVNSGEVAIYVSGEADEDPYPSNYGYQYSNFDNDQDDDLRIELDGHSFGYQNDTSLWGNRQFGEPRSILITKQMAQGSHTLKLFAHGTPKLYRALIYSEDVVSSLPISLVNISLQIQGNGPQIIWETASEADVQGYNIYKCISLDDTRPPLESFVKINNILIKSKGNSSAGSVYQFNDPTGTNQKGMHWYYLEEVDYNGAKIQYTSRTVSIWIDKLPSEFILGQNYPNPFRLDNGSFSQSGTQIPFRLNKKMSVTISIFNINGKLIKQIALPDRMKGQQIYFWNGMNSANRKVSPGIYFYKLSTARMNKTKKLLILR